MTTMSDIWDRTVAVLEARGGLLAGIAALLVFLPAVARAGAQAAMDPMTGSSPAVKALAGLVVLAALVATVWGDLAVLAAAVDPAAGRRGALRMAGRRLLPAIGILLVVLVAVGILMAPIGIVMARSGIDMQAMAGGTRATLPPAAGLAIGLYTLVFAVVALFVAARLAMLYPVILFERTGVGAFGRSVRLTRRLTWRLVGVLLLYAVVVLVAAGAAQLVVGTVAALLFGAGWAATFAAAVAAAAVQAALGVVALVYTAQIYLARREAPALP